jgi:hypothetical protein
LYERTSKKLRDDWDRGLEKAKQVAAELGLDWYKELFQQGSKE